MVEWIYLLKSITYLAVAFIAFDIFHITRKRQFCRIGPLCGIIALLSLINGLVNLAWFAGFLLPTAQDSLLLIAIYGICLTIIFSLIAYRITEDRNILFTLGLFIIALVFVFLRFEQLAVVSLIASVFRLLLWVEIILFHSGDLKKAAYLGVGSSITAIILVLQVMQGYAPQDRWWFVMFIFLFFVCYYIRQHAKNCQHRIQIRAKKDSQFIKYLKLCIFTVVFATFVYLSASLVHEFGHVFAAKLYGCSYETITYVPSINSFEAYTTLQCAGNLVVIAIGGLLLTTLVGLVFYFTSGDFSTYVGYLVFGFGALIANKDLSFLGLSNTLIFIINILGALVVLLAIVKTTHMYANYDEGKNVLYCEGFAPAAKPSSKKRSKPKVEIVKY